MDKLYVEADEYRLESVEDINFALWENGEMVDDARWFKVIGDMEDGIFSLDIKRSNSRTSGNRCIDNLFIRNGDIVVSGDSLFDLSLQYVDDQGNKDIISHVFSIELYWHWQDRGLGRFKISQHAFIDSNILDYGETEDDWLKSKI